MSGPQYTAAAIAAAQRSQHFQIRGDAAASYDARVGTRNTPGAVPETQVQPAGVPVLGGRPPLDDGVGRALGSAALSDRLSSSPGFSMRILSAEEIRNKNRQSQIGFGPGAAIEPQSERQKASTSPQDEGRRPEYGAPRGHASPFGKTNANSNLASHFALPDMVAPISSHAQEQLHPTARALWSGAQSGDLIFSGPTGEDAEGRSPVGRAVTRAVPQQQPSPARSYPPTEVVSPAVASAKKVAFLGGQISLAQEAGRSAHGGTDGQGGTSPLAKAVEAINLGSPSSLPGKYPITNVALREMHGARGGEGRAMSGASAWPSPSMLSPDLPAYARPEFVPASASKAARQALYRSENVAAAVTDGVPSYQSQLATSVASPSQAARATRQAQLAGSMDFLG